MKSARSNVSIEICDLCPSGLFATYINLKTGYIEFARLESSADTIHSAIVNPVVAMAAEVHCQRPAAGAQWLHNAYRQVITSHREFYIARR